MKRDNRMNQWLRWLLLSTSSFSDITAMCELWPSVSDLDEQEQGKPNGTAHHCHTQSCGNDDQEPCWFVYSFRLIMNEKSKAQLSIIK